MRYRQPLMQVPDACPEAILSIAGILSPDGESFAIWAVSDAGTFVIRQPCEYSEVWLPSQARTLLSCLFRMLRWFFYATYNRSELEGRNEFE